MDKLKLLIAEDEKITQLIYQKGFGSEPFKDIFDLTIVGNGEDAFNTYQRRKPDIVVLDIMMPVMSGYNVLKKIRTQVMDMSTVIIMASNLKGKDDVQDCLRLGIDGYIVKPFGVKEIGGQVYEYYKKKYPVKTSPA